MSGEHVIGFPTGFRLDPGEGPATGSTQRAFLPTDPPRNTWAEELADAGQAPEVPE